jgi:hypothetical protein
MTQPTTPTSTHSALPAARRNRAEILASMQALEKALAVPQADPNWRVGVGNTLIALRRAFAEHVEVTEGAEGLYAQLLETAPRLVRPVRTLVREHAALHRAIDAACVRVAGTAPEVLRGKTSDLLRELSRHRQRGADLVYEAYATDIGGET